MIYALSYLIIYEEKRKLQNGSEIYFVLGSSQWI